MEQFRRYSRVLSSCFPLVLIIASGGCGGGGSGSSSPNPPKTLTSISISPPSTSLGVNATQQFSATAKYSDGSTATVTASATWSSSNPSVANISVGGLATGLTTGMTTISASLTSQNATASLAVTPAIKSIVISPRVASVTIAETQQYTAIATYSDGSTNNITSTATWSSSAGAVASVSSGLAKGVSAGTATISATASGASGSASVNVATAVSIPTFHADAERSGLNGTETILTPSNAIPSSFGKLFSYLVDGYVYGEPVLASKLTINGQLHNVLFVATEHDSVYALDADSYGPPLWQVSLLQSGETPLLGAPIQPYEGVTSTPAIDLTAGVMYVVSAQTSSSGSSFRLNALNLLTGAQMYGGPVTIQASVPGTNSTTLTTSCLQRAALLVADNSVFIGFGSCASGWLLAYDEQTLMQTGVFNSSPYLTGEGAFASAGGIWMGGAGPAADSSGSIYVSTGNGPFDTSQQAYGDSVLKFNAQLQLLDYFAPFDYGYMNCADSDLAAGGVLLIPGTSEILAGGKTGKLYLLDTSNLGHEQASDAGATQTLWFEPDLVSPYSASCMDNMGNVFTTSINSYEIFGTAAYFNGAVYQGVSPTSASTPGPVRQFTYSSTLSAGPYTTPSIQQGSYGTTPFISANGSTNGIVWMIDHGKPLQTSGTSTAATLRAYDANLGAEIYNSAANSSDIPGYGIKFTSPVVANGKVYISTGHDLVTVQNPQGEIDVYGLK